METTPPYRTLPCTERCGRHLMAAEHALIGLSPWNGYFTARRVESLVEWAAGTFRTVDVFIPSYEAAYTLIAAGVEPSVAVGRARRAVKKLRGPAQRALARAGCGEGRVHTGTSLAALPRYRQLRRTAEHMYRHDPGVRAACRAVARAAVAGALGVRERGSSRPAPDPGLSEEALDTAARYAWAELPVMLDSPGIFGVGSSVLVYHRRIPLIESLLEDGSALSPAPGQGFVVVTPARGPSPGSAAEDVQGSPYRASSGREAAAL
ncbi:tRNA-dependent cyclodipeptide synthase [Streptomyces sp. KLMMK]|uniref:tRNA-dependent cyclodipeptide synthase n=1 Tax=Streptomyces sp. KLMMK TaxID=3109353 RepID=UPI002FFF31B3